MATSLFSARPVWDNGRLIVRILVGIIMTNHSLEIFDAAKVEDYYGWLESVHIPVPYISAYAGKLAELVGGLFLILGLFTRLVTLPVVITMLVVTFIMGPGNIFADGELSFLLALFYLLFFFIGPGKWSLDYVLFDRKKLKNI